MKKFLIILLVLLNTNLKAQTFTIIYSETSTTDGEVEPLPGTEGGKIAMKESRTILYGEEFRHVYTNISTPTYKEKNNTIYIFWYVKDDDGVTCKLSLSSDNETSMFVIEYKSLQFYNFIENNYEIEGNKYRVTDYLRSFK